MFKVDVQEGKPVALFFSIPGWRPELLLGMLLAGPQHMPSEPAADMNS